nr:DNA polymerase III subunit chi [Candidatus Accumulibacter phosphatis]
MGAPRHRRHRVDLRRRQRSHRTTGAATDALFAEACRKTPVTQVFFYHNAANRIGATAALIGKACAQKKALLVYAPDADIAAALDRQLWAQAPTSFIPHVAADSPLAEETPVLIASSLESVPHDERLFNLSNDVPPGFSRFASLIEIVGQGEEERADGRQRARFYKNRGYAVRYLDCSGKN